MHDQYPPPSRGEGSYGKGQKIFSYVGAVILTFFIAPQIFSFTIEGVQQYAQANYGFSGGLISFFWGIAVGLITFGGTTLALSALPNLSIAGIIRLFRGY
jgi:hypothetical protein